MPPPAELAQLTMWVPIGESTGGSAVLRMVERSEKALPRSVAEGVVAPRAGSSSVALDEAMDRYSRGEDDAFDPLYRQAAPRLRGFLMRLCSNGALADDLTQEAFVRIHVARGRFLAGAAALPWMLAIARNAFLDHTRRHKVRHDAGGRASRDGGEGAQVALAAADARGDEVLAAREMLEVVRGTLDRMPLLQREAFVLLRFEGLSVRDAAQVLGATEAAVKVRAFRAYEALRAALERENGGSTQPR
jgi:RNA polymerase sigma-70 factor, ECF subfamily